MSDQKKILNNSIGRLMIFGVTKQDYSELIEVWEVSVRATHDFLSEEEISRLRTLILVQKQIIAYDTKPSATSSSALLG